MRKAVGTKLERRDSRGYEYLLCPVIISKHSTEDKKYLFSLSWYNPYFFLHCQSPLALVNFQFSAMNTTKININDNNQYDGYKIMKICSSVQF